MTEKHAFKLLWEWAEKTRRDIRAKIDKAW